MTGAAKEPAPCILMLPCGEETGASKVPVQL